MAKLTVNNYDELAARLGEKLGESEWLPVDQERINLFADATLDHQWIHVDPERAKVESPYKSTIAHGYLTLSLLPHMWQEIIEVKNLKMMVNYGMDKMRFGRPCSSVRMCALSPPLPASRTCAASARPASSSRLKSKENASRHSKGLPPSFIILSRGWAGSYRR